MKENLEGFSGGRPSYLEKPGENRVAYLMDTDQRLVKRLLRGSEAAFQQFFDTYFPRLYRFALVRIANQEDAAEDIAQATLCKAISALESYRGEAALFSWLCTICRHEIGAFYRTHKNATRARELFEDSPEIRAALESLSAGIEEQPETSLQRKEISRLVQVTLDYLPPAYGDALEWKYIQGLSVKEIASRLQIGPKAAESLLTRARRAFRDGFRAITGGQQNPSPS